MTKLWTIGHSTHPIEEFIERLQTAGIDRIVDVRTVPRSRHVPQFNRDALEKSLSETGIDYIHMETLGGWRKAPADSPNAGWRNAGFRGYADYMQTDDFVAAAAELIRLAKAKPTAIMCAEGVPFRCHRSLIADFLTSAGLEVSHIYPGGDLQTHRMTSFAVVRDGRVTYPADI